MNKVNTWVGTPKGRRLMAVMLLIGPAAVALHVAGWALLDWGPPTWLSAVSVMFVSIGAWAFFKSRPRRQP